MNKRFIYYCTIAFTTFMGVFLFYVPTHAGVIFKGDYESGTFAGWGIQKCCNYSQQIVTSPVRAGKHAARFELRVSDPRVQSGMRTEVVYSNNRIGRIGGPDEWYGFSIYLPPDYQVDDHPGRWMGLGAFDLLAQWHDQRDSSAEISRIPVLFLVTDLGKWKWITVHSSTPIQTTNDGRWVYHWEEPYKTGVWTDWVIHVKWSYQSDGFLEIWKDGKEIVNYKGPTSYNDRKPVYFKWGIYKSWWNGNSMTRVTKRVIYNDELRIGDSNSSYAEVAPRRSTPDITPPSTPILSSVTISTPQID